MFSSSEGKRTPDEIVMMAPIKAKLGNEEYTIKALRIRKASAWRSLLITKMNEVGIKLASNAGNDTAVLSGLGFVLVDFPEVLNQLVFAYCPSLPEEKIMDDETGATEEQMAVLFGKILQVAFPFQGELKAVMSVLGTSATSHR